MTELTPGVVVWFDNDGRPTPGRVVTVNPIKYPKELEKMGFKSGSLLCVQTMDGAWNTPIWDFNLLSIPLADTD